MVNQLPLTNGKFVQSIAAARKLLCFYFYFILSLRKRKCSHLLQSRTKPFPAAKANLRNTLTDENMFWTIDEGGAC